MSLKSLKDRVGKLEKAMPRADRDADGNCLRCGKSRQSYVTMTRFGPDGRGAETPDPSTLPPTCRCAPKGIGGIHIVCVRAIRDAAGNLIRVEHATDSLRRPGDAAGDPNGITVDSAD